MCLYIVSAQNFENDDLYVTLELDLPKEAGWEVEENDGDLDEWEGEGEGGVVTTQLCRTKSRHRVSERCSNSACNVSLLLDYRATLHSFPVRLNLCCCAQIPQTLVS